MPVTSLLSSLADFEGAPTLPSYGGGSGASTGNDVVIQGAQSAGRRVDNTTNKGFGVAFASANLSGAGEHVKVWLFVTQWGEVTKVQIRVSSGPDDDHELPASEYPPLGGFIPVWLDVSRTPEVGGSANEAAIAEIGVLLDIGDVGGNAPNLILDEISHGVSGLRWAGTGSIADFRSYESTNNEGVLVTLNGVDFCYARLELGDGTTATDVSVEDGTLVFPDQPLVAADFMGMSVDASRSGDTFDFRNQSISSANVVGATRRPDFVVTGTASTVTLGAGLLLLGMRSIELSSSVTITGGTYDAIALTQSNADISGCTIQTRAAASVAMLTDPDFVNLASVDFVQVGAGHAFEVSTPGTYGLDNLNFTGYGGVGTDSAAIDVTATSGTVTFNILNGGAAPTYKTAGATVIISNAVAMAVTMVDRTGAAIENARVLVEAAAGGAMPSDAAVTLTRSGTTVTVAHVGHNLSTGDRVAIRKAIEDGYNGLRSITVTNANEYTYQVTTTPSSPATGAVTATGVIDTGLTDASGTLTLVGGFTGATPQPVRGLARKGSVSPLYVESPFSGSIVAGTGAAITVVMVEDE